jgi:alanine-synthesizing transaminase
VSVRSGRLPRDLTPNRLTAAVARRRASGAPLFDLTESNPTQVGLTYPSDLLAPLGSPAALKYAPEPFGSRTARQAVSSDYARRGLKMPASRIALTASTSEAYALLFKLLCNPGDRVLVPRPSYPLFEHLTALEAVVAVPYLLDAHNGWGMDVAAVAAAIDSRTKAVLVVSPNNPTGSTLDRRELDALADVAAARGVALIGDEVFADYPLRGKAGVSVLEQSRALAFGLGGLSKVRTPRWTTRSMASRSSPTPSCRCRRRRSWRCPSCCCLARRCGRRLQRGSAGTSRRSAPP